MKQSEKQSIHKGHRERVKDEFRNNRLAGTEDYRATVWQAPRIIVCWKCCCFMPFQTAM
jgi:hypothetical protein